MKKSIYILLILSMTLGMLAIAPIAARADCVEDTGPNPDEWTCDNSVGGADADGMITDNVDDIVIVVSGSTVDNPALGGSAIQAGDGTVDEFAVINDGIVSGNTDGGRGIVTVDGDVLNTNTVTADGIGGAAIVTSSGDVLNTSTISADGTAGAGVLTIDGIVVNGGSISADGDSGTGIIAVNGGVVNVGTITADGAAGTGVFTDTGGVINGDTITANGDLGTGIATGSGANTVINIGDVSATGSGGIAIITGDDNDRVELYAGSSTSGDTTAICTCAGDDDVYIYDGATVNGIIDGGADFDTLEFDFFTQSELDLLNPLGDTYGGYTWINFEALYGWLVQAAANSGKRVYFRNDDARGVSAANDGINIYAKPGRIAFIPFSAIPSIIFGGGGVRFQVPNDENWFAVVFNTGPFEDNPKRNWYQVHIYDGNGALVSDEQGFVY